jgi:hypothetical protein
VRDLAIQDEAADLVAATHGAGMWMIDIAPLRQLTGSTATKAAHLFQPQDAVLWQRISRSSSGHKNWRAPRAHHGATFYLLLNNVPETAPVLTVHDLTGKEVGEGRADLPVEPTPNPHQPAGHPQCTGARGTAGSPRPQRPAGAPAPRTQPAPRHLLGPPHPQRQDPGAGLPPAA